MIVKEIRIIGERKVSSVTTRKYVFHLVSSQNEGIFNTVKIEIPREMKSEIVIEEDDRIYIVGIKILYREIAIENQSSWEDPNYGCYYSKWLAQILEKMEVNESFINSIDFKAKFDKVYSKHKAFINDDLIYFEQLYCGYMKDDIECMWSHLAH